MVYFAVLVVCCLLFGLRHRWSAVFDQSRAIDVAHNSSMRCGIKIRKAGPAEEGKSACRCRKCQGDRSDVSSSDAVVECVGKGSWQWNQGIGVHVDENSREGGLKELMPA